MECSEQRSELDSSESSDNEFWEKITEQVADAAGITTQEVYEMTPSQIEQRIEEEQGEPLGFHMPQPGSRHYSPLLDEPPTKKERKRRKENIDAILDPDKSVNRLKWKYRAEDAYEVLGKALDESRYFMDETLEFARDIGKALKPK